MNNDLKKIFEEMGPRAISAMILSLYMLAPQCTNRRPQQTDIENQPKKTVQHIDFSNIDKQIKSAHQSIDSLRYILNQSDEQIFKSNPLYTHESVAYRQIDSLNNLNYALIISAYKAATEKSPLCTARKNVSIFNEFSNIPAVQRAHKKFKRNANQISKLRQEIATINASKSKITFNARHDVIAVIQIHQKQIDSLLNTKHQIIQENSK